MTTPSLSPLPGPGNLLDAALAYAVRGWSIIAVSGKRAAGLWKPFQERPADEATLRKAFGKPGVTGVAVITGRVSGGLAVRDYDRADAYQAWAIANPEAADRLPTVQTARGFHVYGRLDEERFVNFGGGELRADSRHYVLLPPSLHPDGTVYAWTVPLPPPGQPLLPLPIALRGIHATERQRDRETETSNPPPPLLTSSVSLWHPDVEALVERTLPTRPGERFHAVFRLARALKARAHLAEARPADLLPILERWHARALPVITTKPLAETLEDFVVGWGLVKYPEGTGPLADALGRARSAPVPPAAVAFGPEVQALARLCRELQSAAGAGPFFLSCRTAARLLGLSDHKRAWRYLLVLAGAGLLAVVEPGEPGGFRATRYRYIIDREQGGENA